MRETISASILALSPQRIPRRILSPHNIFKTWPTAKGSLTLVWLLAQDDGIIPIPGTKEIQYLEENFSFLGVALNDQDNASMRTLVDAAGVVGGQGLVDT